MLSERIGLTKAQLEKFLEDAMRTGVFRLLHISRLAAFFLCVVSLPAWSLEDVTLQLKWHHQFQFAGYYAAIEKGFYKDAGLNVIVREAKAYEDPVQNVLEGHADYGVGTSELLLLHNHQQPVSILAVIFQHSPLALLVPTKNADQTERSVKAFLQGIKHQPVMMEPNSAELIAYLEVEGLKRSDLMFVDHTLDIDEVMHGEVAAMSVYITDEPFLFKQSNVPYTILRPVESGIDFYGDNLFTTQDVAENFPERTQAFRTASLKGWKYAMSHPEEMIDLIFKKYSQRHSKEHLRFEYQKMLGLINQKIIHIGYMNPDRWRDIAQTYVRLGMLPENYTLDSMLFRPYKARLEYIKSNGLIVAAVFSLIVALLLCLLWRFNLRIRKKARWLNAIFNYVPSGLLVLDKQAKVLRWNRQVEKLLGWSSEEVQGKSVYDFLVPLAYQATFRDAFNEAMKAHDSKQFEFWAYTKTGQMILCEWQHGYLKDNHMLCTVNDITSRKELENKLSNMAHTDPLTGVANRTMFFQKFEEAISLARRRKQKVALLFVDLDDFKIVNDKYGHEVGDVVLCEVVQRVKMAVREADMLARIGGDEFVLILHDCETQERALQVAEKVLFNLERPINVSGLTVVVGGSIGISFYPDDGTKPAELLKSADNAMYSIKETRKNGIGLASQTHSRH